MEYRWEKRQVEETGWDNAKAGGLRNDAWRDA